MRRAADALAPPEPIHEYDVHWGLRVKGPNDADEDAAITNSVLDYLEGFYEGDPARIERTVHPSLVRRTVMRNATPASHLLSGAPMGSRKP